MELKMEMSQNLALSQRMIQSTEILQMSSQELDVYIKELAVENPVIDIEDDYQVPDKEYDIRKKLEWLKSSDEQNRVYYSQEYNDDGEQKDKWNFSENLGEDLAEYLYSQLVIADFTVPEYEVVDYMIHCLDSKGYLEDSLEDICIRFSLSMEDAESLLKMLQGLDPAGVCARNLQECLLIQLDRLKSKDLLARKIIADYLELVGKNQLHIIAKKLKVSVEEVLEACETIKLLNPKPGNCFSSREHLKYITPDVTIVKLSGYYEILLNEYTYPKITLNDYYLKILKDDSPEEAKTYVADKVKQAEWVLNCISQRHSTLLHVTKAIIDHQEAFFAKGPGNIKPMKLSDIAAVVGIHESTVSRAVRDKYVQCSWGVYPMNYFFSKGIEFKGSGDKVTPEEIKTRMQAFIDRENKQKPYSDRMITELLNEQGITISRRTVAKYREKMGLKDASGRKSFA